ncbi:50S ribosomal protein L22 [Nitrolancea hollandica]|uniref:Large ribosomal subunit protein uL22 n=1 Tax=Nitrolancea hollandica Lb TaxID=1129897 RepID=I4EC67_9BACT|nr:50S ribosomal protein L22 [Nitrolancea hollandica]CCF82279.1 ribosomal protein L22 (BL17) [Nitrolancea hollandica Lb]
MEVTAKARGLGVSARKARLVVDAVRGKSVPEALAILRFLPQKSAKDIAKVVKSAAANAEHNYDLDPDALFVKYIYADEGPTLKRWRARARGRVNQRLKRTAHVTVIVEEKGA